MKILVGMPVFNRLQLTKITLPQMLCFIEGGMPRTVDVVVIDDCSTDGTREWLKTQPVAVITHTQTEGIEFSHNQLYHRAKKTGVDYVVRVDSDMLMCADWLDHLLSAALKYPEYAHIGGYVCNNETINRMLREECGLSSAFDTDIISVRGVGGMITISNRDVICCDARYEKRGNETLTYGDARYHGSLKRHGFKLAIAPRAQGVHLQEFLCVDYPYELRKLRVRHAIRNSGVFDQEEFDRSVAEKFENCLIVREPEA